MIPYAITILESSVTQPPTLTYGLNSENTTPAITGLTCDTTLLHNWTMFRKHYASSYPKIPVHRYVRNSNYLFTGIQYIAEPKVHSVQIALSTYANVQFSKKISILPKISTYVQYLTSLTFFILLSRNPKTPMRPPNHPKMEKSKNHLISLHQPLQTSNESSPMPPKLNLSTIATPPPLPSNSAALSQRIQ